SQVDIAPPKCDDFALPGACPKQSGDKGIIETVFLAEVTQDSVPLFRCEGIGLRCRKPFPFQVRKMVYQPEARLFRPCITHHGPESPIDNIPARLQAKATYLIKTRPKYVQRRQINVNHALVLKIRQDIPAELANVVMMQPWTHNWRFPALYPVPVV